MHREPLDLYVCNSLLLSIVAHLGHSPLLPPIDSFARQSTSTILQLSAGSSPNSFPALSPCSGRRPAAGSVGVRSKFVIVSSAEPMIRSALIWRCRISPTIRHLRLNTLPNSSIRPMLVTTTSGALRLFETGLNDPFLATLILSYTFAKANLLHRPINLAQPGLFQQQCGGPQRAKWIS